MWCCHCKQDVPAVARSVEGPLVCVLCETELVSLAGEAPLGESGVELQSYDQPPADLARPASIAESESASQQLRRIGRKLQSRVPVAPSPSTSPTARIDWEHLPPTIQENKFTPAPKTNRTSATSTKFSWAISLLLSTGVAVFSGGVCLLIWATLHRLPEAWQWGMTSTLVAEGMLVVGLVWMARRLWSNGRHVNRQLEGVDRQLAEMQQSANSPAANHGSSASYYQHFNQGASPHMLVANLRGQVDQLAARIAE